MDSHVNENVIFNKPHSLKHNGTMSEGKYRKHGYMLGVHNTDNRRKPFVAPIDEEEKDDSSDEDEESSTFSANKEQHGFIEPSEVTAGGHITAMGHKVTEGDIDDDV